MNLKDEVMNQMQRLEKQVYIADDHIVINVSYEYNIALSRCDTPEKLLHWVWHLTEKSWMTNEVMRRFIDVACRENKIEMHDA
ncbi:MAG: hypothetical protein AAGI88_21685 [Pseudomonadota bacterium]